MFVKAFNGAALELQRDISKPLMVHPAGKIVRSLPQENSLCGPVLLRVDETLQIKCCPSLTATYGPSATQPPVYIMSNQKSPFMIDVISSLTYFQ